MFRAEGHIPSSTKNPTHLQHLQLLQPLLYQLLLAPRILLILVLTERIARPPGSVFSEVICGELLSLAEQLAELYERVSMGISNGYRHPSMGGQAGAVMVAATWGTSPQPPAPAATISSHGHSTYQ